MRCCSVIGDILIGVIPQSDPEPPQPLPLTLVWDDIGNVPVADPTDPDQWYAIGMTGITFTSITVDGNSVNFYSDTPGSLSTAAFKLNENLLEIIDSGELVLSVSSTDQDTNMGQLYNVSLPVCTELGLGAFAGSTNMITFSAPLVETIGDYAMLTVGQSGAGISGEFLYCTSVGVYGFSGANVPNANFPVCTTVGDNGFATCQIIAANFPLLTTVTGTSNFSSNGTMETANFPLLEMATDNCFNGSSFLVSYNFDSLETIGVSAFSTTIFTDPLILPAAITAGDNAFTFCDTPTVSMPLLTSAGFSCFAEMDTCTSMTFASLTSADDSCFGQCDLVETITIGGACTLGIETCQQNAAMTTFIAPLITDLPLHTFRLNPNMALVDTPDLTTIDSAALPSYGGMTIVINVNVFMETSDGGNPDPVLVAFLGANPASTVNYIP